MCFFAIVLVCGSQPVNDERGPALFFCFLGILESLLYVVVSVGLLVSAILLWVFCAAHWANMNPAWATMPALATAALFLCSGLYFVEICVLINDARRCSWRPPQPTNSVLPH
ncbi:Protein CBG15833 [Caenorhabditis briggsae]|uniref:Protein CBG15833 n=1 Tax=Caenorhabditis briggsae TaxID=6238 RepID=A8XMX5_CAEBR|nr:Protein CBG15833 [Caenorhabditis briggsae]CAP34000.2 Protein CBG15833 [Caenorhabditis briggsae]